VAGSLLMLSSTAAMALGLGQTGETRPGQPLLAEIPIISNVAGELDGATARLAPPEVFARVGLEPPRGVVGGLQFDIMPNAQGRMVVRVTSSEPVSVQALSFLVEVDWGKGRAGA
jgi:pilus assembly protein FimV